MTEIIEPNPLLVEYFEKVNNLKSTVKVDLDKFDTDGEWQYVESNIERNIFLLKRLDEKGLLSNKNNICDCGIGFGTVMYDLYLQSKDFTDKEFTFTGIEKYDEYVDSLKSDLLSYWNGDLNIVHDDIMNYNYSDINFIWFYTPFKVSEKLMDFFEKIIDEIPVGGIIIGLDQFRVMEYGSKELIEKFNELSFNMIDDIIVYQKIK
jgi:hypothetical protein